MIHCPIMVGDEIFPLKNWLMRPYPGRQLQEDGAIYNYRHSLARRVIENAFGILVTRWRLFNTSINASVKNIEKYVKAAIVLHNYLRVTENATYSPVGFVDSENSNGEIKPGHWRSTVNTNKQSSLLSDIQPVRGSRYREDALSMRDGLKDYVNSKEGELEWQCDHVRRT